MVNLLISHLNCNRTVDASNYLQSFIDAHPNDVHLISLNEPNFNRKNKISGLTYTTLYCGNTVGAKSRAAIIAYSTQVDYTPSIFQLMQFSDGDCTVVQVVLPNRLKFYLISIYLWPNDTAEQFKNRIARLELIVRNLRNRNNDPIVIATDSNCRHPDWDPAINDQTPSPREEEWSSFLYDNSFILNKRFTEPTFCSGNRSSCIDMIVTTNDSIFHNSGCEIVAHSKFYEASDEDLRPFSQSDHAHLILVLDNIVVDSVPVAESHDYIRFNTKNSTDAQWDLFREKLISYKFTYLKLVDFPNINSSAAADFAVDCIEKLLVHAARESFSTVTKTLGKERRFFPTSVIAHFLDQLKKERRKYRYLVMRNYLNAARSQKLLCDSLYSRYRAERRKITVEGFRKFCE